MLYWDEIKAKFSDGSKASFYRAKVPGGWLVGIFLGGQAVSITFWFSRNLDDSGAERCWMSGIQGHKSNEISPLNRVKYEYPFFIIEIAGEP